MECGEGGMNEISRKRERYALQSLPLGGNSSTSYSPVIEARTWKEATDGVHERMQASRLPRNSMDRRLAGRADAPGLYEVGRGVEEGWDCRYGRRDSPKRGRGLCGPPGSNRTIRAARRTGVIEAWARGRGQVLQGG
jgi:hypothetical protein